MEAVDIPTKEFDISIEVDASLAISLAALEDMLGHLLYRVEAKNLQVESVKDIKVKFPSQEYIPSISRDKLMVAYICLNTTERTPFEEKDYRVLQKEISVRISEGIKVLLEEEK